MVDLILSAGPSDPCFEESDDHPTTEDRTTSSECKTILNNSPELDQELSSAVEAKIGSATGFNQSACPEHKEEVETEAVCSMEGAIEASTR
jgi:hypothetical protein